MRVLVTGASGFLGEHVVRALQDAGSYEVVCLSRSRSPILTELGVTQIQGSVIEGPQLEEALDGCLGVFHLAGIVSRDPDDGQRLMRTHVDGTRRVLEASARKSCRRVVLASSSGTIAVSTTERIHDESSGYATEVACAWPYYASKIFQEKLAFQLAEELQLEVVSVNPSLLLGPGDRRLSSTADILKFLRGEVPVVPRGGVNFVDVRDAAKATVAALQKGRAGEQYLLGGPNWTFEEYFNRIGRAADKNPLRLKLPSKWQTRGAKLMEGMFQQFGKEPPIDHASVDMGQHFWWVDSSKAQRELGFSQRDPGLTLVDTVKYLRRNIAQDL